MNSMTLAIAVFAIVLVYLFILKDPKFVDFSNKLLGDIKPGATGAVG